MARLSAGVFASVNSAMDQHVEGKSTLGLSSVFNAGPSLSGVAPNMRYDEGSTDLSRSLNI